MAKTVREKITRKNVELLNVGDFIEFEENGKIKVKKVKRKDLMEDGTIILVSIVEADKNATS